MEDTLSKLLAARLLVKAARDRLDQAGDAFRADTKSLPLAQEYLARMREWNAAQIVASELLVSVEGEGSRRH